MNVERVTQLRDHIAAINPANFDMNDFGDRALVDCGTPVCIGGWACAIFGFSPYFHSALAGELLGMESKLCRGLFFPNEGNLDQSWNTSPTSWSEITPAQAVQVLDHLLTTGKVDWSIIGTYPQ